MCSSGGMRWMAERLGWSFHAKWVCASTIPGMSVAPWPSTTVTPAVGRERTPEDTREIRLPCTSTSPAKGCAPEASKMRTLVKRTLAMSCLPVLGREEIAQLARALLGTLVGGPVAAARIDHYPRAGHAVADGTHGLRRRDGIFLARHEQDRTLDGRGIDGLCRRQRLAAARITLGVLAHQRFAHQRHGDGPRRARVGGGRCLDDRLRDGLHAGDTFAAGLRTAGGDVGPRGFRGREQRTEESQAPRERGEPRREVETHDGAERVAHQVGALHFEPVAHRLHALDVTLDRERALDPGGAAAARQVGTDRAVPGERAHERCPVVGGAAESVHQHHRVALAVDFHRDAVDPGEAHWTGFSSTPMPSISRRTRSPRFRYFGGLKPMPTPTGVPVAMTSPGCSVMPCEMHSISAGTSKIRSRVCASWRFSPFTNVRTFTWPSHSSRDTITGPMGQKVSKDLPRNHCLWRCCQSRAVTSFTMV